MHWQSVFIIGFATSFVTALFFAAWMIARHQRGGG